MNSHKQGCKCKSCKELKINVFENCVIPQGPRGFRGPTGPSKPTFYVGGSPGSFSSVGNFSFGLNGTLPVGVPFLLPYSGKINSFAVARNLPGTQTYTLNVNNIPVGSISFTTALLGTAVTFSPENFPANVLAFISVNSSVADSSLFFTAAVSITYNF